jgi:hypothetical protein
LSAEWRPAKDEAGDPLYDFVIENLQDASLGRPQALNLKEILDKALGVEEADLSHLKKVLVALVEDGQRHTMHV